MCGIAGLLTNRGVEVDHLRAMASALFHRGPDDEGVWSDPDAGIGLAHRRLAILDLSPAGHQPMASSSGRYMLVFNGEIYNHQSIRSQLPAQAWRGHSDTETLLAAFEHWGVEEALRQSTGMFALALWDRRSRELILARDRMGEKPLYYGWQGGHFLFASELKALARLPGFSPSLSRQAVDQLLRRAYIPPPHSIYRGFYKLLPGTLLRIKPSAPEPHGFDGMPGVRGDVRIERYWSAAHTLFDGQQEPITSLDEAADGLEKVLTEAVLGQSLSDVPLGTFLSGGVDSSLVTALHHRHGGGRTESFTVGFDEAGFDESPHAKAVAGHLGTRHHEMRVGATDALDLIPQLATMYDEPFADSSQLPTHLLCRAARRQVTVALSGDGGDELFGGYDRFRQLPALHGRLTRLPKAIRSASAFAIEAIGSDRLTSAADLVGLGRRLPQLGARAARFATLLRQAGCASGLYAATMSVWPLSVSLVRGVQAKASWPGEEVDPALDPIRQIMLWDQTGYLPDDILCKVDRASMATSLETRAPLLDHHVVGYAARIPTELHFGPDGGKQVLRHLLYKYVPRRLIDRPKAGFSIPLDEWLRGPLRDWAEELLAPERLEAGELLHAAPIRRHWQAHLDRRRNYSSALWPVLMLQAWRDKQREVGRPAA